MCLFTRKTKLTVYQKKDNSEFIDKKIHFRLTKTILSSIIFVKVHLNFSLAYYTAKLKSIGMIN